MVPKFHFFMPAGYALPRVHEVVNVYFRHDPDTTFHTSATFQSIANFIKENQRDPQCCVVFYYHPTLPDFEGKLATFVSNLNADEMKMKILFVTFDFWFRSPLAYGNYLRTVFLGKNCYVSTFANGVKALNWFHGRKYRPDKFIFMNTWACYRDSFVPLNVNPIVQVAVSGSIGQNYPERCSVLQLMKSDPLLGKLITFMPVVPGEWKNQQPLYNRRLNKYLCCFASSVYAPVGGDPKKMDCTGLVLLKNFEILASGALLLVPQNLKDKLQELGLEDRKHFVSSEMSTIAQTIKWITNPTNRERVDEIRREGQQYARENLTTEKKYRAMKAAWIKKMFR